MTQSLDQQRAAFAWKNVRNIQGKVEDYVNLAKAAPSLIMGNGLMQTLAFFQSKGKEHHTQLLGHLLSWLKERRIVSSTEFRRAMDDLSGMSSELYLQASQEALAILKWIRQLAAAQVSARNSTE